MFNHLNKITNQLHKSSVSSKQSQQILLNQIRNKYSDRVIDHYNNPRNVGSLDKNKLNVGSGLVGAPACGDVMKLQIEVDESGTIKDAKFRTFGCLVSDTPIATPNGYKNISELKVGDNVWAFNGEEIVSNVIERINTNYVHYSDLLKLEFEDQNKWNPIICTKDHIWWNSENKPVEAEDLKEGYELLQMSELKENQGSLSKKEQTITQNGIKIKSVQQISNERQLKGIEIRDDMVKTFDLKLREGANVYFAYRVGTHNCGSAIASSSYATEMIKGKTIDECLQIKNKDIASHLALPPVKLHCSMLAEDAIKAAVYDYKKKKETSEQSTQKQ